MTPCPYSWDMHGNTNCIILPLLVLKIPSQTIQEKSVNKLVYVHNIGISYAHTVQVVFTRLFHCYWNYCGNLITSILNWCRYNIKINFYATLFTINNKLLLFRFGVQSQISFGQDTVIQV